MPAPPFRCAFALVAALIPAASGCASASSGVASSDGDKAAITALLMAYQADLNASDAAASVSLYADDGVVMTPNHPTVVGKEALRRAYAAGAAAIAFDVRFHIEEIVPMAPDWAFARTSSAGTSKVKATGVTANEANQELFVLRKDIGGTWKIARYSFSSTGASE